MVLFAVHVVLFALHVVLFAVHGFGVQYMVLFAVRGVICSTWFCLQYMVLFAVHGFGVQPGKQKVEAGEPGFQTLDLCLPQTGNFWTQYPQHRVPCQPHTPQVRIIIR